MRGKDRRDNGIVGYERRKSAKGGTSKTKQSRRKMTTKASIQSVFLTFYEGYSRFEKVGGGEEINKSRSESEYCV